MYTIWRSEITHFKSQHLPYNKTPTEWEILGDLAARLHHREEAKDAYQRCLEKKFSAKAWGRLLEYYVEEGDVQRALNAIIRLQTFQHRWYQEMAYPTTVAKMLYTLMQREGVSKLSYSLVSSESPSDGTLRRRCEALRRPFPDLPPCSEPASAGPEAVPAASIPVRAIAECAWL